MELLNRTVSFEEFLQLEGSLEWVDGKVVSMAAVDKRHSELNNWLATLLRFYVDTHDLGAVHQEPFVMRLGPDLPGRSPDLMVIGKANLGRLQLKFLDGPADVCIEIVSAGSQSRDRGEKYYEYEQAGVPEYWLLDPIRQQAEFYALGDNGRYQLQPLADGVFRSGVLPGFWLRESWLWADPLPRVHLVARELGLIS